MGQVSVEGADGRRASKRGSKAIPPLGLAGVASAKEKPDALKPSATGASNELKLEAAPFANAKSGESVGSSPRQAAASPAAPGLASPALSPEPAPAPLDPEIGAALLASRSPADADGPGALKAPVKPKPIALEVSPPLSAPSGTAAVAPASEPLVTRTSTSSQGADDWGQIRKKLQSLGVSQYTIEGTPAGRVKFACLIPLAGRQAISQRIEAEADDELQAAKAVVKRIALWRAAQASGEQGR